jgi:hypothetical protein
MILIQLSYDAIAISYLKAHLIIMEKALGIKNVHYQLFYFLNFSKFIHSKWSIDKK